MKRLHLFLAVAGLLLILNILHWQTDDTKRDQGTVASLNAQDFALHVSLENPTPPDNRDLFYKNFHKTSRANRHTRPRKIRRAHKTVKTTPIKPIEHKILKDIEQPPITLVGTAFRREVRFAYLIRDDQRYSVGVGDKIGQDLVVQKIVSDRVTIKNLQTGAIFDIRLTGGKR